MDAHKIHNSRWNQIVKLSKINMSLSGYSRAAFRTGFYLSELNIMLDAGPQNFNRPGHIFITHGHGDHIAELPFTLITDPAQSSNDELLRDPVQLYGPKGSEKFVIGYIKSLFELNSMHPGAPIPNIVYNELSHDFSIGLCIKNSQIHVEIIRCDHSIPTISYLFSVSRSKLLDCYQDMSKQELVSLKRSGVAITKNVVFPLFAFICDCSIKTVQRYEEEIFCHPYVIIECTFLAKDELERAESTQHIHWSQLKPYVIENPDVVFILIHFSLRYRDDEIDEFFAKEGLENVVPWTESVSSRTSI